MNPVNNFTQITLSLDHTDFSKNWNELINHPIFRECHPQFSDERRLARIQNDIGDVLLNGCRLLRIAVHEMSQRSISVCFFIFL